jgi:hypothetical protein
MVYYYKYYVFGYYPSSCPFKKTQRFGDWILSPSSGKTYSGPEIGASSIYWIQLSRFYLRTETESSLRNVVFFLKMDKTMDNVQKHNTCRTIRVASSGR